MFVAVAETDEPVKRTQCSDLVSVVIPTYNRAYCLPRAVDSVLSQTHSNLQILIIDDGSKDNTRDVVKSRYGHDARVEYIVQENTGVSGARNRGLAAARGEFIAFLDSDDVWLPWKLQAQLAVLRSFPDAGMVWSDMQALNVDGSVQRDRYLRTMYSAYQWFDTGRLFDRQIVLAKSDDCLPDAICGGRAYCGDIYSPMIMGNLVHTSTVLMRRERMLQVGQFEEKYTHGGEDYHFHLKTCRQGRVAFLDLPTICYQLGLADQITRPESQINFAKSFLETIQAELKDHREQIRLPDHMIRDVLAEAHGWVGSAAFQKNQTSLARQECCQSLGFKLRQPSIWKILILSLLPKFVTTPMRWIARRFRSAFAGSNGAQLHV